MPTTPNGTVYTIEAFTSSAGEPAWRAAANPAAARMLVVLFCHGNPGPVTTDADQQFAAGYATDRNWVLDNGWGYIEGHGAGANWGNAAGRAAYEAMYADTAAVWDIEKNVVVGRSMGALPAAWLASQSLIVSPKCVGFISLSGTADLSNRYSTAGASDKTNMNAAYGVTDDASWRAAVAAYDPMLAAPETWDGRNAIMQWDTSDTTVPYASNGQAWDAKFGPRLALRRTQSTSGGDHNSTPNNATHTDATIAFLEAVQESGGTWSDTWSDVWPTSGGEATGGVAQSLPALSQTSDGAVAPPASVGAAAAIFAPLASAATGTAEPPSTLGVIDAVMPALIMEGAGTSAPPAQAGSLTMTLPALTASGTGATVVPERAGAVDAQLPALTAALVGSISAPGGVAGAIVSALGALTAAAAGTSDGDAPIPFPDRRTLTPIAVRHTLTASAYSRTLEEV